MLLDALAIASHGRSTLSALENQMDILKPMDPQLVLMDHEVDAAPVAPHHTGPFLGVDLNSSRQSTAPAQ